VAPRPRSSASPREEPLLLSPGSRAAESGRPARSGSATGRRFGVRLLGGQGRAVGRPVGTVAPAGTATHHADTLQLRERHARATEGRSRSRGRRRPSDRKARASQHRPLGGWLGPSQPGPSWRSSVGHLAEHVPRARPRGDVALCPSPRRFRPASIGGERGGGVAVKPGLGRFAAARGRRATPGRWRMPSRAPWRSPTFAWALKVAVSSPGWKPLTQEWGRFWTVNWTPNAETRLQRARRAPGRRP
jgi:hypothetical protein